MPRIARETAEGLRPTSPNVAITAAAVRYVEKNPVRAEMVQKAEEYRWSSTRGHVKGSSDGIVSQRCDLWQKIRDGKR